MRLLRRMSWSVAGTAALSLLFFILYYLYLWLVVDLRLIYHGGGMIANFPVFYIGWGFFREFLSYPGGLVDYVSAFLAQFFYVGWAGAVVATAQVWLIWLCTGMIIKAVSGRRLRWVCLILPVLLLIIYARYSYPFTIAMSLLVALGFVCLYLRVSLNNELLNFLVFLVLSIILYAIAGVMYLLFAALCGMCELLFKHRPTRGLVFLLSAPVIVHIESLAVFNISIIDVLEHLMLRINDCGKSVLSVVYALYVLLPLTLAGIKVAQLLPKFKCMLHGGSGAVTTASETAEKREQGPPAQFLASFVRKAGAMLAPLLACALVVYLCHNDKLKTLIAVDYYSCNRMWPQVLEASVRYPHNNKYINHAVNRALYHTGRLGDDMFVYMQQPSALMLSDEAESLVRRWRLFDTYIDLGHMNLAESMLVLCMEEKYGERPIFLKRLALINMVKGNLGAARVCLGALSKTLFNADWARNCLKKINTDPNLSTDKEVQYLRSIMPAIDRDFESINENVFLDLLARNKHNRMAFEYLMGFYLLTGQFDKFAGNLCRLDDFDYGRIPRVYEEAILFYNFVRKTRIELPGREISAESRERFIGFRNIYIGRYGTNDKAALKELSRDYGDSYLFYRLYGQSGMKK